MRPLYLLLFTYAAFITLAADGIGGAIGAIPLAGLVLGPAIAFCLHATLGAGLILLLLSTDMFHPRFGPFISVGGFIPYIDFLPFWIGLVVAGIIYDLQKNGESLTGLGSFAKQLSTTYLSGGTALQQFRGARSIIKNERAVTGRPPVRQPAEVNGREENQQTRPRVELKSPNINRDVTPRAANDNRPYAQAA